MPGAGEVVAVFADLAVRPNRLRRLTAGFTAANMLKDLRLAQQAAGATAAATPLGAAAANLYQLLVDGGAGGLDFSGIMQLLRRVEPRR